MSERAEWKFTENNFIKIFQLYEQKWTFNGETSDFFPTNKRYFRR